MRTATHTTSHFEHTNFEFLGNLNAHKVSVHRKDTYVSACKMSYRSIINSSNYETKGQPMYGQLIFLFTNEEICFYERQLILDTYDNSHAKLTHKIRNS